MNFSLHELGSRGMGNMLESESSVSEVEEAENESVSKKHEVRTEGDGMESEEDKKRVLQGSDHLPSSLSCVHDQTPQPLFKQLNELVNIERNFGPNPKPVQRANGWMASSIGQIESPKELPPKSHLISLNPVRVVEKSLADTTDQPERNNSSSAYRFNNSPVLKQKSPKFVPYEPYKGAVRSMTDVSLKIHSRTESTGSSTSGPGLVINPSNITELRHNTTTSNLPDTMKFQSNLRYCNNLTDTEITIGRHSQNHSETLLKERLKMQGKDVSELQCENARLKKLLVDSMSGSRQVLQTHELGLDPFSVSHKGNSQSISESFDNLSDEIEVWRSKFLSSCVLVEQLTKENQVLKGNDIIASQLFQDIKNKATLTPELFEQINHWLHHRSSFRAEFYLGANSNDQVNDIENDGEN